MNQLPLIVLIMIMPFTLFRANGSTFTNKYEMEFNTNDGLAIQSAFQNFDKEVPDSEKIATLLTIVSNQPEAGKSDFTRIAALLYCIQNENILKWTDAQEKEVYSLGADDDSAIRTLLIDFWDMHQSGRDRIRIVSLLKDTSDQVRMHALIKIRKLPNANAIYTQYVQDNQGETSRNSYKFALRAIKP